MRVRDAARKLFSGPRFMFGYPDRKYGELDRNAKCTEPAQYGWGNLLLLSMGGAEIIGYALGFTRLSPLENAGALGIAYLADRGKNYLVDKLDLALDSFQRRRKQTRIDAIPKPC